MTDQAAAPVGDTDQSSTQPTRGARPWRGPRLGLRARITLAFTLSAALLSTLLAATTWGLTRENIVNQRESSATRQALRNASVVENQLNRGPVDDRPLREVLCSLESDSAARTMVQDASGRWTYHSTALDEDAVPPALLRNVADGQASRMRIALDGNPELVIGIPLPEVDGM